jgi:thioredoxin 1
MANLATDSRARSVGPFLWLTLRASLGWGLLLAGCEQATPRIDGIEVALTDSNFEAEVLNATQPVLVDFSAAWCGPCRRMDPIVALLSVDYEDRVKVCKLDVDKSPQTARDFGIRSVPTFVLFVPGREPVQKSGTQSYQELARLLDGALAR